MRILIKLVLKNKNNGSICSTEQKIKEHINGKRKSFKFNIKHAAKNGIIPAKGISVG
jgi:hypothetical protein